MEARTNCAYGYKTPGIYKAPAQQVGEMFAKMEENGGLTPKAVVEASRPVGSLLHDDFEWDNDIAAEAYREVQAAAMIRCVTIIKTTTQEEEYVAGTEDADMQKKEPMKAFVVTPGRKHEYVRIDTAMKNEVYKNYLLEQARSDLRAFTRKYNMLTELDAVIGAIEEYFGE